MSTYEIQTADSPSATTVKILRVEASSERAAYRKVAATLDAGAVVRSVVELPEVRVFLAGDPKLDEA